MAVYRSVNADGANVYSDVAPVGVPSEQLIVGEAVGHVITKAMQDEREAEDLRVRQQALEVNEQASRNATEGAQKEVEELLAPANRQAEAAAQQAAETAGEAALDANLESLATNSQLSQMVAQTNMGRMAGDRAGDILGAAAAVAPVARLGGFVLSTVVSGLNSESGLPSLGDQSLTTGQALADYANAPVTGAVLKGVDIGSAVTAFWEGPNLLPALSSMSVEDIDGLLAAIERTDNTVLAEWFGGAVDKDTLRETALKAREQRVAADAADKEADEARKKSGKMFSRNVADEGTAIAALRAYRLGRGPRPAWLPKP